MNIKKARAYMNKQLQDEGLRGAYRANIAMLIYDDQTRDQHKEVPAVSTNLSNVEGCNLIADKLIDLIFK